MSHTPGPWYVGRYGENDSDVCAESGPLICAVRGGAADPSDTAADADAHLIAAAPDLLAALIRMRDEFNSYADCPSKCDAVSLAFQAIEKAGGE